MLTDVHTFLRRQYKPCLFLYTNESDYMWVCDLPRLFTRSSVGGVGLNPRCGRYEVNVCHGLTVGQEWLITNPFSPQLEEGRGG